MDIQKLMQTQQDSLVNNFGTQSSFLPLVKKISIGNSEKMKKIKSEVLSTNRENKIKSIIEEDIEYKEMDIREHPDYYNASGLISRDLISVVPLPGPSLVYLDYLDSFYESERGTSASNIR